MKRIRLTINGRMHEFVVGPDRVLLDLLREDLGLTGAKQSCDRNGECGACTVIVNKRAVLSCLVKVSSLKDARVITVEGLGTPENPHLIQEAYVLSGAIQCGFCTPGMIMATNTYGDPIELPGPIELISAHGSIFQSDGKTALHLHGNFSDSSGKAFGGHVVAGGNPVLATLEAVIAEIEDVELIRQPDPETGRSLYTPQGFFAALPE